MDSEGPETIEYHLKELNEILRKSAFAFCIFCIFWSFSANQVISIWLDASPLPLGPNNENLSVYGPFDWIQMRWSLVILFSMVTLLPLLSTQIYKFAKSGLYPRERNWLTALLFITTTFVPVIILAIWAIGLPALFEFSVSHGTPEGTLTRYDARSVFSIGLGITWVLVIWSITTITLSLTRIFGMVTPSGKIRFRNRLLAISAGILVLTLPMEYDGLRLLIAFITCFLANSISRAAPMKLSRWVSDAHNESV